MILKQEGIQAMMLRTQRRFPPNVRLPACSRWLLGTAIVALMSGSIVQAGELGDTGTPCGAGNGQNCWIGLSAGSAGHSDTGATPQPNPITHGFVTTQTLTAGAGQGAIDFTTIAGDGGDADHDGNNGGDGGAGGDIGASGAPIAIGSGVTANGGNTGAATAWGIVRLVTEGGNGGGGQGAHTGTRGKGGTGGAAGDIYVDFEGAISSTDGASPGLFALSQGGSVLKGDDGGTDFYSSYAGNGGASGSVSVTGGGSIDVSGAGIHAEAVGGAGGAGPNDSGGIDSSDGADGGIGGAVQSATVTFSGSVTSQDANGIEVWANGGAGGTGGTGGSAPASTGGKGGDGNTGGTATGTIDGGSSGGQVKAAGTGLDVQALGGAGGAGGVANGIDSDGDGATGGSGGQGGNGGTATAKATGINTPADPTVAGTLIGISADASGGAGGTGAEGYAESAAGGVGGSGGTGGTALVQLYGSAAVTSQGIGVQALSNGGGAGAGGEGNAQGADGGKGGTGGAGGSPANGGSATVSVAFDSSVTTTGADTPKSTTAVLPGVLVSANGGEGGAGGTADAPVGGKGGSAGYGGPGGTATATVNGVVTTGGGFAYGVMAQSVGGVGGNGGDAKSLFASRGGAAENGGAGGSVFVNGTGGTITTTGTGAGAILGQSVGGGGGAGGNALSVGANVATIAIGGNGGAGGDGAAVEIGTDPSDGSSQPLDDTLITRGAEAPGIVGQSIGGAGGSGGNAVAAGAGVLTLAVGGDGKGGGTGGSVTVTNDGVVTTFGLQSGGIAAQSVGGGGGNGGSGVSVSAGVMTSAVAVGGSGAGGGSGGIVGLTNNDQVTTYGADAYGMKAQSISGGGGEGGSATAVALAVSPDPEVPAVSVSVGIGGTGGAGGDQSQSPVTLTNNGFVSTAGDGAIGLFAQNVAGGGGNGGDSTAASYSAGDGDGDSISVSLGVAGSGGAGGTGGAANVTNNALVVTLGESAHGVMAQSLGGGGGIGGVGDTQASNLPSDFNVSTSISVGGQGGTGSTGGPVTVDNNGSIATQGDGARGIYAHSVGGGGGASGGGVSKANAQDLSLGVTVGGNAGSGGDGGTVTVTNTVDLLTRGSDADGIYAQSVGGGGGSAGKGSSTAGGAQSPEQAFDSLTTTLSKGLGLGQNVTTLADGVFKVGDGALKDINKLSQLESILPGGDDAVGAVGDDDDDGDANKITLHATIGGQGGAAGSGNTVKVDNSGSIATFGARSDGIFAQNLGGGGGVGGASSFSGTDGDVDAKLMVGASGLAGGDACVDGSCNVTVTNEASASIATSGVTANGITAQSIGGGGGKGGAMASAKGALKDLTVTLGGSGGGGGEGGPVTVDNYGVITTSGRHAYGILAQSVGGGGGIAHVLSSDKSTDQTNPDDISLTVTIGGDLDTGLGGVGGAGGPVTVNVGQSANSGVETHGTSAIGVVAQSIGGGGGLLVTSSADTDDSNTAGLSNSTVIPVTIGGANGTNGDGGTVSVDLDPTDAHHTTGFVQTYGTDAYGVLAQSVGGGGGLVVGGSNPQGALAKLYSGGNLNGDGGSVSVVVNNGFSMGTGGAGAIGVLAQSIGGGGGVIGGMSQVDVTQLIQATPTTETGQGGNISVDLESGGNISTSGTRAHVIVAQSLGGGGGVLGLPDPTGKSPGVGYAFASSHAFDCGSDCTPTGNVTVTLGGNTVVRPLGPESYGVVVQSQGNGTNDTTININGGFIESWAKSSGAIFVAGAGTNIINNAGTIDDGSDKSLPGGPTPNATGVSIAGNQPATINNSGLINGSITLPNGTSGLNNTGSGTYNPGATVNLGTDGRLNNAGTINPGGKGRILTTDVTGNLVQTAGGTLAIDADHASRESDRLEVTGNVDLGGKVAISSPTLTRDPLTIVHATGEVTLDPALAFEQTHVLSYTPQATADGGVLAVPKANFHAADGTLNGNRQAVAEHLQSVFDRGEHGFGEGLAGLATDQDGGRFQDRLDSLTGETLAALGGLQMQSGRSFRSGLYSCPTFGDEGVLLREQDCGWGQVTGSYADQSGSGSDLGYDVKSLTTQFGGQKQIAEGWFLGGSLAYQRSDLESDHDLTDIDGNGVLAGLVLKRQTGPLTLSLAADGGYGWYDSKRQIDLVTGTENAKGSPEAGNAGLHARASYELPFDRWYLKPSFEVGADYVRTGSFKEHGASPFDLDVDSEDKVILSATPGIELGGRVDLAGGSILRPHLELGVTATTANNWKPDARFKDEAGGDSFRIESKNPNLIGHLGVGIDMITTASVDIKLQYGLDLADDYTANSGMLKVAYRF